LVAYLQSVRKLLGLVGAAAVIAATWYVIEWMPGEAAAASGARVASATSKAAPQPRTQTIESVRLDGAHLPVTTFSEAMETAIGTTLSDDVLDRDRRAIRDLLIERGHWTADVGEAEVTFDYDGGAHVVFRVVPGPVFHVRAVTVTGDLAPKIARVVPSVLTVTSGDDISPARLARNATMLTTELERVGIRGATVTVETSTDRQALAVDVTFVVAAQVAAR
jgi:outer membrane protein assembly factor BamA